MDVDLEDEAILEEGGIAHNNIRSMRICLIGSLQVSVITCTGGESVPPLPSTSAQVPPPPPRERVRPQQRYLYSRVWNAKCNKILKVILRHNKVISSPTVCMNVDPH